MLGKLCKSQQSVTRIMTKNIDAAPM